MKRLLLRLWIEAVFIFAGVMLIAVVIAFIARASRGLF